MAIHEDVPGLQADVYCRNQPMGELEDPNANDNFDDQDGACPMAIKYIECVDGAEFSVRVSVNPGYLWGYRRHIIVARVFVDGSYVGGKVFSEHDFSKVGLVSGRDFYSQSRDRWFRRNFRFTSVKTVDDAPKERVEKDLKSAKDLGTIEVRFTRELELGPILSPNVSELKHRNLELAEKSLKGKALSHGTSYGSRQDIMAPHLVNTSPIIEDDGPILKIVFLYRSKEALKRELIIPRSPSPAPTINGLTPEERDRLARERLDQLRDVKIKREKSVVIKREFNEVIDLTQDEPPRKKSRHEGVVDLTDD